VPTLNVFDNNTDTRATVLIIDGTRVGDVRIYDDQVMQTVIQRWGTGGGNVPLVFPMRKENEVNEPIVFEPGALGRLDGPRSSTEVVHTLRAQMGDNHPAIAYSIREDATANNFSATEIETARALQSLQPSVQSHHAQTFVADDTPPAVVRRLTPIECERLQGFPDNWTADQADSHRYKQMGNAVTVNVIAWIGARL